MLKKCKKIDFEMKKQMTFLYFMNRILSKNKKEPQIQTSLKKRNIQKINLITKIIMFQKIQSKLKRNKNPGKKTELFMKINLITKIIMFQKIQSKLKKNNNPENKTELVLMSFLLK